MSDISMKAQFADGIEVGAVFEPELEPIVYAIMGGVSVSLTKTEDGRLFINIEGVDEDPLDAVMEVDGMDVGTIQFAD